MVQPSLDLTQLPIVIAGPTASGKSALAMRLAKEMDGEIICADSRQVYQYMRIGTAGPSLDEMAQIPHHGFHTIDPKCEFDAGQFLLQTDAFVADVLARNRVPILVGGTGMYLRSYRYGLSDVPKRDDAIRQQLFEDIKQYGLESLHQKLAKKDPVAALKIAPQDEVRIVRALEIIELTGQAPSDLRIGHRDVEPRVNASWVLLWPDREWLTKRLAQRVDLMLAEGLVDEAVALRDYLGPDHHLLSTMGYEEALWFADGKISLEMAREKIIIRQRQYAKRQQTWFKKEAWWQRLPCF